MVVNMLKVLGVLYSMCLIIANSDNMITCPSECICDMTNGLRSARCIGEKITTVEVDIPSNVQYIDLSNNLISKLDDHIFTDIKLQNVIVLNISSNMLNTIALRSFIGLKYLQIVDLSHNLLSSLNPILFEDNQHLRKLFLANNKLGIMKLEIFLESDSLEILDISKCLISYIPPGFFSKLPYLRTIDITGNFLIQLDVIVFKNLQYLKHLFLLDNKLSCNDKTTELIQYLQRKQIFVNNVCEKIEKSQKIIQLDEMPEEKDNTINWHFDVCDIEMSNEDEKISETDCEIKCETKYDNSMISIFLIAITFGCGVITGISIACACVLCKQIFIKNRRRKAKPKTPNILFTRRRPSIIQRNRDQLLLHETNFDIGLSTPVLSRARTSTAIT